VSPVIPVKENIRLRIEEFGIVPSIKPKLHESAAADAIFAAETLIAAGIPIAEIKWSAPGAIDVVSHLEKKFPKMVVGVDVLDLEAAERCVDAGAKFLTSPGFIPEIVEFAIRKDVVVFPGALTPTEVMTAWNAGADFVKVFPCSQVGGSSYIRALHGPLPDIRLIASGGVNQQTAADFMLAGATALGIGVDLVPAEALRWRKEEQIHELARRFLNMVKYGRTERIARS
jgi:2-dehydro-3-deoxyphosphogluconate aldolase/(4S)-4-hydroxy-2-oxoglutarate aldolase